ncbi:MAG TPA: Asp-tRNA(Asn)/Glu-tRNA(Gln) amidotransferase subunit GatB [Spirochaetia bacterium]|nr:Asp-tRNA(Asn)/Glu-tRNA(Gln) amidotransferase subunit GatB [Spirochaetia bacterium]
MYASYLGLEVHTQLLTRSKVFCGCRAAFGDEPNTNVCPVCMGYPGVLPALNGEAIRMGYLVARALNCALAASTLFERKNYFYPDLPKNYQISQFRSPLGTDGWVEIEIRKRKKRVRIREVHLEEDAGKMIHAGDVTLLDFNRTGTPLLEIVTQPDMEVGEEAEVFLQELRRMVRYLGVCDGNMEEGSLRCDANVSVNPEGKGLGSKVEVKNLNSFKFVRKAITYEIERQTEILERGGSVTQETRLWNENRDVTEGMRTKESSSDYRYFPEPDLPPFVPGKAFLDGVEASLVELPQARRRRLMERFSLSEDQADFICEEKATADYFEEAVRLGADPQSAALWLAADVKKHLNRASVSLAQSPLSAARFAELLGLLSSRRIHGKIAKAVLERVFAENKDPLAIIREKDWEQITDPAVLERSIEKVMQANAGIVASIRGGDRRLVTFLIGEIMRETSGRADPSLVQSLVGRKLAVSVIQILSLGGAIVGKESAQGDVVAGDPSEIMRQLEAEGTFDRRIAFEEGEVGRILSEEITPADWARLAAGIDEHLRGGRAAGIVVTHGTDTLAYTASLLFWLFPKPPVPVVLTASLSMPGKPGSDAIPTLRRAVQAAAEEAPGVYVVFAGKVFSPVNLKFERMASDGFRNWNLSKPCHSAPPLFEDLPLAGDRQELQARFESAINSTLIIRVYPGMRGDHLVNLMDRGVKNFVLELYDTGTANLRDSPYSLRRAFLAGREKGVRFFCTSQQEGIVDFSRYASSHELWREGAIPMGPLTTESAWTKLVVCAAFSENEEEMLARMEQGNADACL